MKKVFIIIAIMIIGALTAIFVIDYCEKDSNMSVPGGTSGNNQSNVLEEDEKTEETEEEPDLESLIEKKAYKGVFTVYERSSPESFNEIWYFQDGNIYFYRKETDENWSAAYTYLEDEAKIRIKYAADNVKEFPFVISSDGKYIEVDGEKFTETKLKGTHE